VASAFPADDHAQLETDNLATLQMDSFSITNPSPIPTPEPASLALLTVATPLLLRRKPR
jgi:hypothetical protein